MGNYCFPRLKLNITIFNDRNESFTFTKVKVFYENESNLSYKINKNNCVAIIPKKYSCKNLEITYAGDSLETNTILYCKHIKNNIFLVERQVITPTISEEKHISYEGDLIVKCYLTTHKIINVKVEHNDSCF